MSGYDKTTKLPLTNSSQRSVSFNATDHATCVRRRELFAYVIILVQACALFIAFTPSQSLSRSLMGPSEMARSFSALSINNQYPSSHQLQDGDATNTPMYQSPVINMQQLSSQALVERVWHSRGSPLVNEGLLKGSCWCSGDDFCMCTPALAIDVVLKSGSDHVWLVQRLNGQFALMGGFVEVAESVEDAAVRELQEEMNLQLERKDFTMFGVYSDPRRDARRHAISVAFVAEIPESMTPQPGDDAKKVLRVPLDQIDSMDLFVDHKTILQDYKQVMEQQRSVQSAGIEPTAYSGPDEPFKRSMCVPM